MGSLWIRVLCVALGGAAGAVCRWGVSYAINSAAGDRYKSWYLGTLAVNVIGCFAFGVLFRWLEILFDRHIAQPPSLSPEMLRLVLLTGFMGAFTTYSTFANDTHNIFLQNGILRAAANVSLHVVLGWLALAAGMTVARPG